MIIVPDRNEPLFIIVYEVDEASGEFRSKAINDEGETIISGFDRVLPVENVDSRRKRLV